MTTLRRRHVQTAQYIEVRDQDFYFVKTWKKNHVTGAYVPKDLGVARPGEVLVAIYEPKTGQQTFEVAESMAAVHAQYVLDDDGDVVTHPPTFGTPTRPLPRARAPWEYPDAIGAENPRLRFLDRVQPKDV